MTDDREQKTEDRGQRTDDRFWKLEVGIIRLRIVE